MIRNIKARIWGKHYDPINKRLGKHPDDSFYGKYYIYEGTIYHGCRWGVFFYSAFNESHDPIDML